MPSLFRRAISKASNKISTQYQEVKKQRAERQSIQREAKEIEQLHRTDAYKKEAFKQAANRGRALGKRDAQGAGGLGGGVVGALKSFSTGSAKMLEAGNFNFDFTGTGKGGVTNFMDRDPFRSAPKKTNLSTKTTNNRGAVTININSPGYSSKKKKRKRAHSYTDNPLGIW
jgi:hypothetical protein